MKQLQNIDKYIYWYDVIGMTKTSSGEDVTWRSLTRDKATENNSIYHDTSISYTTPAASWSFTIWHYDSMTLWQYDTMTVLHYDSMALWQCDTMTVWHYDSMTLWQYDTMLLMSTYTWLQCWACSGRWYLRTWAVGKYWIVTSLEHFPHKLLINEVN